MLRLPDFDVTCPDTLDGVLAALSSGSAPIAGGTDLLPNLKHKLGRATALVSLHAVPSLREEAVKEGVLVLGACRTLAQVATSPLVREHAPALAQAAGVVAAPQIRNTATLGGNLNLDTRCRYVNQSDFWRSTIGGCLKADGVVCHVVPGGRRCVAAMSSDAAPAAIALNATAVLASTRGVRSVPLEAYYKADGIYNTIRAPDELLVEVRIPLAQGPRRATYVKWRPRGSIDFPLVSVALSFDLDSAGAITSTRAVAGALGAKPRVVDQLDALVGRPLDASAATLVAQAIHDQCKPVANVPWDPAHRRELFRVLSRRAVEELARM